MPPFASCFRSAAGAQPDPLRRAALEAAGATLLAGSVRLLSAGVPGGLGAVLAACAGPSRAPDFRLRIGAASGEIAPGREIRTTGFDGRFPGPVLRVREGEEVRIAVTNASAQPDLVHWHGLAIPSRMDGAMEEGSPMIMPGETFTYAFTARPAGTRWYHSHAMAGRDLTRALYSGLYGMLIVEPKSDPGRYDREVLLAVHHWEPSFVSMQDLRRGPPPDNGLEVAYRSATLNDRALGHGDPVRVRAGERVLFRFLNASATDDVMLALPRHRFEVVALDGNPVPVRRVLDTLMLAPGERIDALVEMNMPGKWILGSVKADERAIGLGVVVEYAGAAGSPRWEEPAAPEWDYPGFALRTAATAPEERIELRIEKIPGGRGGFNRWTVNGKSWPDTERIRVKAGRRYRLAFRNDSGDMHPMHLHRHSFELARFAGQATSGLVKDVVNVPRRQTVEVDFTADNPGPSLLHCHMQEHQDFGFMSLIEYA